MSMTLTAFQDDFIQALYTADQVPASMRGLVDQPGFAVYRNTLIKACIDSLTANYPSVVSLVGNEWFRATALIYVRATPPSAVSLLEYGAAFPDFLQQLESANELPYLADVARLDRLWGQTHAAADDRVLASSSIMQLSARALGDTVLPPHASARWAWFADMPIYTIWCASREQRVLGDDLIWTGEGVLLSRCDNQVCWQPIDAGTCAFLDACQAGRTLERASNEALLAQQDIDIAQTLSELINASAFGFTEHNTGPGAEQRNENSTRQ